MLIYIICIILGFFLGIIVCSLCTFFFNKQTANLLFKKLNQALVANPIETIIGIITFFVIIIIFFDSILGTNGLNNTANIILSFYSSIIFAWLLTKYSSEISSEKKQKELALTSYSHSLNIECKLERDIKTCELIQFELEECKCNNGNDCILKHQVVRLRDFLIEAKSNSKQNLNEWANFLAEEFNIIEDINSLNNKIDSLKLLIQELNVEEPDYEKNFVVYNSKIENHDLDKERLVNKLNQKFKYTLRHLDNIQNDQYLKDIKDQINEHITRKTQRNINFTYSKRNASDYIQLDSK